MAYPTYIPISGGSLPLGFCPTSEQERFNAYLAAMFGILEAGAKFVVLSPTQPTVEQQDWLWVQTDDNNQAIQLWTWSTLYGLWLWPHSVPPNDSRLMLWAGDTADIDFIDGGDSTSPVNDIQGPFWEIDTDWTDKLFIGAGAIAAEGVDANVFDTSSPDYPSVRGVYVLKRTARKFLVA